ncbi:hypothetical protein HDU98_012092 [Podochytrium sp. JEL0797]|nr:hypothetical protein HDU98_012092 [Podochytrium sp. JEL0797]
MFSATLSSPSVRSLAAQQLVNKPIHEIDTTSDTSLTTSGVTANVTDSIHKHIPQSYAVVAYKDFAFALYKTILHHVETHAMTATTSTPARVIVFFNASKQAAYFAKAFKRLPEFTELRQPSYTSRHSNNTPDTSKLAVYELHARLEQGKRARVSDAFRANTTTPSVLFTTDVSARGVDYPDVTLVIQLGAPSNGEQYIHRVGRTGRAGKSGEGVLFVEPYEKAFLRYVEGKVGEGGVKGNEEIDVWVESEEVEDVAMRGRVEGVFEEMGEDKEAAEGCYAAYLGYYTQQKYVSKAGVGLAAARYAKGVLRLPETPALSTSLLQKMGLMKLPGIVRKGSSGSFSMNEFEFSNPRVGGGDSGGFKRSSFASGGGGGGFRGGEERSFKSSWDKRGKQPRRNSF